MFAALMVMAAMMASGAAFAAQGNTLVYAIENYTRINPAVDEHGELSDLIFDGLMAHDAASRPVPRLAESFDYDAATCTYTFHLVKDAKWHDGHPFTAADVEYTFKAIMDPANESENAPNYDEVKEIKVIDDSTIVFTLSEPNVAFLDYMTMAVLPKHLLDGEDLQTSAFFRKPVGTGPFKIDRWDEGQAILLVRNDDYFRGPAKIEKMILKVVADDSARVMQLRTGELDLTQVPPRDAIRFEDAEGMTVHRLKTSDYRGIMYNFGNPKWSRDKDLIPAFCCAIDRKAILDAVVHGHGMIAYGPLQRNEYDFADVERWSFDRARARKMLEDAGCEMGDDGFYHRNGERVGFSLVVRAGDQVRRDIAQAAAQQLKEIGVEVKIEIPAVTDWKTLETFLIGWGSPFDADDHTYKVFGTGKAANYSSYSNEEVDRLLTEARQTDDPAKRRAAYAEFQKVLALDPAYTFICYIDASYVAKSSLKGIDDSAVMGHHGYGIFWNVHEWSIEE